MRWIGSLPTLELGQRFVRFLAADGVESAAEKSMEENCRIWVIREEDVPKAQAALEEYRVRPDDPMYMVQAPIPPLQDLGPDSLHASPIRSRVPWKPLTLFLAALTIFIFLVQQWQGMHLRQRFTPQQMEYVQLLTPIEKDFLIQVPEGFVALDAVMAKSNLETPPLTEAEVSTILAGQPSYVGIWGWAKQALGLAPRLTPSPFLPEVREGEVWRLFTPALLHAHLLHIGFNLLWLFYLGRHIEQRLGSWRMLGLILVVGVLSNFGQYLVSGPLFYGLSGVICGLGGFVWSRQRVAPWEGYPIPLATLHFLAGFVLLMVVVEFLLLLAELVHGPFSLGFGIANTAHIIGGLAGIILGRLPYMRKHAVL